MSALAMLVATDFTAFRIETQFLVEMGTSLECLLASVWPVLCKPFANGRVEETALSSETSAYSMFAFSLIEVRTPLFIGFLFILVILFCFCFLGVYCDF